MIAGLVVAGAGGLLLLSARGIEQASGRVPEVGAATLPTALSVLLVLSGLALALTGMRHRHAPAEHAGTTPDGEPGGIEALAFPGEPPVSWRRLAVVVALFIGYALVFIPLGYMLATALYLSVMVTVIDRPRWRRNLVFAVIFAVVVYYAFTELLNVQLPAGVLG
ncbi:MULTISPECIES: tripartite tricarboxylate transporter TctB family protein [unclassified Modestobacter]|uniref:tripartite tricarboxylate transporter TctB family protein n=1 Tax=unclassified Modestobacter TaxID=2643866 RepID=UPI0022AB1E33|nr:MULTISPECIES: tripartite tricarboxylate transporter TctB family protein [unclassified Modestobacter]MCZ2826105.1 tripartite tricarboxylate transporter TctB family protein [Modestobacter sp. VKM Ac-2981]MCZ2852830.1 tripartite tricarboxylate transporter TctB family protein [Modestobacter sp. VKM Ac-2982]